DRIAGLREAPAVREPHAARPAGDDDDFLHGATLLLYSCPVAVKGFLVVDGDAHYLEPIREMTEYMAEPWRTRLRGADPSRWIPVGLGDRMLEGRIRREDAAYTFG